MLREGGRRRRRVAAWGSRRGDVYGISVAFLPALAQKKLLERSVAHEQGLIFEIMLFACSVMLSDGLNPIIVSILQLTHCSKITFCILKTAGREFFSELVLGRSFD